jgi:hypothetical protein
MAFSFFGFKKKHFIQDIEAKPPTPTEKPPTMSFDDALAAQVAAQPIASQSSADIAPVPETEVLTQMGTLKATREDVIAAYKIFLGRLPESMEVVDPRVGVSSAALLVDFLASKEFLDQPPKAQLMLAVAKKILEERQLAKAAP